MQETNQKEHHLSLDITKTLTQRKFTLKSVLLHLQTSHIYAKLSYIYNLRPTNIVQIHY